MHAKVIDYTVDLDLASMAGNPIGFALGELQDLVRVDDVSAGLADQLRGFEGGTIRVEVHVLPPDDPR